MVFHIVIAEPVMKNHSGELYAMVDHGRPKRK